MKRFKNPGRYPFMILLIASTLLLTVMGYAGKDTVYADYAVNLLKNPRLSVVFEGIKDKNYPWKTAKKDDLDNSSKDNTAGGNGIKDSASADNGSKDNTSKGAASNDTGKTETDNTINKGGKTEADNTKDNDGKTAGNNEQGGKGTGEDKDNSGNGQAGNTGKETSGNPSKNTGKTDGKGDSGSKGTDDTGKGDKPVPGDTKKPGDSEDSKPGGNAVYEFATVKESYFDDALFIGDSRTVGLSEYSGWKNPTYYADVGLTIYDIFDKKIAEVKGEKITVDKALQQKSFKKIYIMLGINEMGTGTAKTFTKRYKEVVERITELQPNAIIFVEGIMNVTKKKSDTDSIFNNKNIKERNEHLATLADNKKIFYIDVNEAITDSTGGIPEKYTFDNIHLKAAYYKIWTDFLLKHGVKEK